MKNLSIVLVVVLTTSGGLARAQSFSTRSDQGCSLGYGARYAAGHVRHSATAAEGYLRGVASMIEAQARYNLFVSQAMLNLAEVRRIEIENRQRRMEIDYALREANRRHREQEHAARRPRSESMVRDGNAQPDENLAEGLAMANIEWPSLLEQPKWAGYRKLAKRAILCQASGGRLTPAERSRLYEANRAALAQLKKVDEETSPADRSSARQFIERLAAGSGGDKVYLAANK